MKLLALKENDTIVGYSFNCPGCGCSHSPYIRPHKAPNGASWQFNGDTDKPTFIPSILSTVKRPDGSKTMVCYLFVTQGEIEYLSDCTHSLAGQKVPLPDTN